MMSPKFAKQLLIYRNVIVAIGNAAVTWVVLIIAPLGLFAVIMNTVLVFISSLILAAIGDGLLKNLLNNSGIEILQPRRDPSRISTQSLEQWDVENLPEQQRRNLPKDR